MNPQNNTSSKRPLTTFRLVIYFALTVIASLAVLALYGNVLVLSFGVMAVIYAYIFLYFLFMPIVFIFIKSHIIQTATPTPRAVTSNKHSSREGIYVIVASLALMSIPSIIIDDTSGLYIFFLTVFGFVGLLVGVVLIISGTVRK